MTLKIYNAVRQVPKEAQKEITGGRLKGMTDINPMWRLKTLTEQFGPCGIGWRYEITEKRLQAGANNEIAVFVDINLYIKVNGGWSEPIPGTGGSMFVAKERNGLYTSDECYKMALTDAISVACKALGFGADVYWQADRTKYTNKPQEGAGGQKTTPEPTVSLKQQSTMLWDIIAKNKGLSAEQSNQEKIQFVAATLNKKQPQSKADWLKLVSALEEMVG